ncbi:phosphopentomutase [Hathewaya limosa]|uniref:Phosphopentomutase n=1 Tax=Hathewaya limosa TaxID=1536 RepID=A0ABU0JMP6_HATLI|nr:phosphopentomutase [Hathewaya limosa]MDQ0478339.1 phosphopentomutase [Hathewaya limosa]
MKRAILLVIDSLGIGEMDDVKKDRPNDIGSNTLKHVLEHNSMLKLNNLENLGLINCLGEEVESFKKSNNCIWGVSNLKHEGADSFYGHYEIVGAKLTKPILKSFSEYIDKIYNFLRNSGYSVNVEKKLNKSYLIVDNKVIISDNIEGEKGQLYTVLGDENSDFNVVLEIGKKVREVVEIPRIAVVKCNINLEELKECIEIRFNEYIGINAEKANLYNRGYKVVHLGAGISNEGHCIKKLVENNIPVVLVGKVSDIISMNNIKKVSGIHTSDIIKKTLKILEDFNEGFLFINIQETDLAGHLQDKNLYGKQLEIIDSFIGEIKNIINDDDLFIITADHGNDPTIGHGRHTREKVPVIVYKKQLKSNSIGLRESLSDIGATVCEFFHVESIDEGKSFFELV